MRIFVLPTDQRSSLVDYQISLHLFFFWAHIHSNIELDLDKVHDGRVSMRLILIVRFMGYFPLSILDMRLFSVNRSPRIALF